MCDIYRSIVYFKGRYSDEPIALNIALLSSLALDPLSSLPLPSSSPSLSTFFSPFFSFFFFFSFSVSFFFSFSFFFFLPPPSVIFSFPVICLSCPCLFLVTFLFTVSSFTHNASVHFPCFPLPSPLPSSCFF